MSGAPGLAAITLSPNGGGVAAVARLAWQVLREEWGNDCRLYELNRDGVPEKRGSRTAARLEFGARIAADEILGRCGWMLYTHLAVARVQRVIPSRVRRPYVVFLHGIEVWKPLTGVERSLLDRAALVIANSAHTARCAEAANAGLPPIAVCPLGIGTPEQLPRLAASRTSHTILTVARMVSSERYKGHDQLLEALPAVRRRVPDARLTFVGTGDDVDRLRMKARALGVAEAVAFPGFLDERALAQAYRDAAVFAMPSRGEGFGLVYLEAMAASLPCLGSTHDAAGEIIQDSVTGHLVDQDSTETIGERLSALLADPERRGEMGRMGRLHWERQFTYEHFRRRLRSTLAATAAANGSAEPRTFTAAG